jgi:hypothetical protein
MKFPTASSGQMNSMAGADGNNLHQRAWLAIRQHVPLFASYFFVFLRIFFILASGTIS